MEKCIQNNAALPLSGGRYLGRDPHGAWALFSAIGYERLLTALEAEILEAKLHAETRQRLPRLLKQDNDPWRVRPPVVEVSPRVNPQAGRRLPVRTCRPIPGTA